MLAMRPATPKDQRALEAMIQARSDWMAKKQLPNWRSWGRHVHELAANCTGRYGDMWVLTEDSDRIVGCTTILTTAAPWIWTGSEAGDSAVYLNATVTDPTQRHRKLGTLIANWAVDHAARGDISYVRRDCTSPALAAYYEKQQFTPIRTIPSLGGRASYALQRKSQIVAELTEWLHHGRIGKASATKPAVQSAVSTFRGELAHL